MQSQCLLSCQIDVAYVWACNLHKFNRLCSGKLILLRKKTSPRQSQR